MSDPAPSGHPLVSAPATDGPSRDRRRLEALDVLATRSAQAQSVGEVVAAVAAALEQANEDVPFALVYLLERGGEGAVGGAGAAVCAGLAAAVRIDERHAGAVSVVDLSDPAALWPLQQALSGALERPLPPPAWGPGRGALTPP